MSSVPTRKRILVVDDEYTSTEVLSLVLDLEGYEVITACNGRQALERTKEAVPDLVITDYMMPILNGAALARALRADDVHRHIPIVLITGVPESGIARDRALFHRVLRKPFRAEDLLSCVRGALGEPEAP